MTTPTTSNEQSAHFQFYFRALFCFAAAGTLASDINWSHISPLRAGMMVLLFTYAYAVFWVSKRIPAAKLAKATRWFHYGDASLAGSVLALINFSLLPSILFITMIQFNALMGGGTTRWARDNTALAIGAIIGIMVHQPNWVLSAQFEISLASLIGITTYFCASAVYTYSQMSELRQKNTQLQSAVNQQKIRAYKLSRYLSPSVWSAINQDKEQSLQTERKRLTIFFSDIKDFSQLSEELEAETLTELLNNYLTEMSKIVSQYGGTIDKFMGDGIMVIFGDHDSKGLKGDALRCISMSIAMRRRMKVLQQQWFKQAIKKPLQIRMGINTGYCTVGTFGTSHHLDYTVLGTHVNLASRLESAASPGEILISYETCALVKDTVMCRDKGEISVKGFSHPIKVYQVIDLRRELGKGQSYFEQNLNGFSMHMDLGSVRNYDRERVIQSLQAAAEALKEKDTVS